jgi:hypothetical protein
MICLVDEFGEVIGDFMMENSKTRGIKEWVCVELLRFSPYCPKLRLVIAPAD